MTQDADGSWSGGDWPTISVGVTVENGSIPAGEEDAEYQQDGTVDLSHVVLELGVVAPGRWYPRLDAWQWQPPEDRVDGSNKCILTFSGTYKKLAPGSRVTFTISEGAQITNNKGKIRSCFSMKELDPKAPQKREISFDVTPP